MSDIAEKHFEDWHYVGQRVIHGANWKVALDGYLEGYHFQAAHPETIAPRTYTNVMAFEAYGPHMLVGYPAKTIEKLKDIPKDELWQHENDGYDFIRLFFPNVSIFVAPEITQIAQLIPGPGHSKIQLCCILFIIPSQKMPKRSRVWSRWLIGLCKL